MNKWMMLAMILALTACKFVFTEDNRKALVPEKETIVKVVENPGDPKPVVEDAGRRLEAILTDETPGVKGTVKKGINLIYWLTGTAVLAAIGGAVWYADKKGVSAKSIGKYTKYAALLGSLFKKKDNENGKKENSGEDGGAAG